MSKHVSVVWMVNKGLLDNGCAVFWPCSDVCRCVTLFKVTLFHRKTRRPHHSNSTQFSTSKWMTWNPVTWRRQARDPSAFLLFAGQMILWVHVVVESQAISILLVITRKDYRVRTIKRIVKRFIEGTVFDVRFPSNCPVLERFSTVLWYKNEMVPRNINVCIMYSSCSLMLLLKGDFRSFG